MVLPLARSFQVMVNVFLPFQPDVTSVKHVLGKFEYPLDFAVCFVECILDISYSTSYTPREAFRCLLQVKCL